MSKRDKLGPRAEGALKRPAEHPPIDIAAATFGAFILAVILAVPASLVVAGKLEINPWLIFLLFFALLVTVPPVAKTSKPLTVAYALASLVGTVALANSVFHVGYLEGGIGWALFALLMYAGSRNTEKAVDNEHKPRYDYWDDWDGLRSDEPPDSEPHPSPPGPIYIGPLRWDPEMGLIDSPFDPSLGYYDHHDFD